jgi:Rod binding domain-containing protein
MSALPGSGPSDIFGSIPVSKNLTPAQAKAKSSSQEFEQVFLSSVLAQMFSGLEGEGPMGSGEQTESWRKFLTDAYAREITAAGGVGIGDTVYRELLAVQEAAGKK